MQNIRAGLTVARPLLQLRQTIYQKYSNAASWKWRTISNDHKKNEY